MRIGQRGLASGLSVCAIFALPGCMWRLKWMVGLWMRRRLQHQWPGLRRRPRGSARLSINWAACWPSR